MNEQLQEALATLLTKTVEGVDATTEFLTTEIPDVIQQLLLWHGIYNFILFVVGLIIIAIWVKLDIKLNAVVKVKWVCDADYWGGYVLAGSMVRAVALLIVCFKLINIEWLKVWIAPKVWLIEYTASLTT